MAWYRHIKAIERGHEQGSARARPCCDFCQFQVAVISLYFIANEKAVATHHVETLCRTVVEQIVRVAHRCKARYAFTCVSIIDQHFCRLPATNIKPMLV